MVTKRSGYTLYGCKKVLGVLYVNTQTAERWNNENTQTCEAGERKDRCNRIWLQWLKNRLWDAFNSCIFSWSTSVIERSPSYQPLAFRAFFIGWFSDKWVIDRCVSVFWFWNSVRKEITCTSRTQQKLSAYIRLDLSGLHTSTSFKFMFCNTEWGEFSHG